MLATTGYAMSPYLVRYDGAPEWRLPDRGQHGLSALHRLYPCADGWVYVGCCNEKEWRALTATLERREWLADRRFADGRSRDDHDDALAACPRSHPVAATRAGVGQAGPSPRRPARAVSVLPKDGWMEQEKLLIEADHPVFGNYWRPPAKVGFEGFPARLAPACAAGEHSRADPGRAGLRPEAVDRLAATGITQAWPSAGE